MSQIRFGHRKVGPLMGLMAAAILLGIASQAQAQQYDWNVQPPTTGDWTNGANWTSNPWTVGGDSGTVINNGGTANVAPGETAVDLTGNGYTYIGTPNGNGWVNMTGGQFAIGTQLLGYATSGVGGSGCFTQSAGVNTADSFIELGPWVGGYGEYDMSGGSINGGSNGIMIGSNDHSAINATFNPCGTGVFTQTGGSVGSFGIGGNNDAVGLVMAGKINTYQVAGVQIPVPPLRPTTSVPRAASARHFWSAALRWSALPAPPRSPRPAGPTPSSAAEVLRNLDSTHNTAVGGLILGFWGGYQPTHWNYGDSKGTYNLEGGLLGGPAAETLGSELIGASGGTGTFNQSGGVNAPNASLYVGGVNGGAFQTYITISKASAYGIYNLTAAN